MDLVLGVSMTSRAVRWVLVDGMTGEGDSIDRGAVDLDGDVDPDDLLEVLLVNEADNRIHAVGVTWTIEAEEAASGFMQALAARNYDNVIAVSELEATDVLAAGIAGIAEYEDVAVCVVEPDAAVVAIVNSDGVTVDRIGRPLDGADVVELPSSVIATLAMDEWQPDAIFVVGSADDLELIISTLDAATESPVISAAEADLALARGAALASARAVNGLDGTRAHRPSRVSALTSVLVAAVVIFVVSLSVALGLTLVPGSSPESPQAAGAVDEQAAAGPAPPPTQAAVKASKLAESLRAARPVLARQLNIVVPPPPAAGTLYSPPAYIPPPAPAFVPPPPPPVYVPPVVPQPRLRDRIIERIPIINRFHEPEYQQPR